MNMANSNYEEPEFDYGTEKEFEYRTDFSRRPAKSAARGNKFQYARKGRAPQSHNGIHRRRNKRFSW